MEGSIRARIAKVMFAATPYADLHVCGDPWEGNKYHQGDKAVGPCLTFVNKCHGDA